MLVVSETCWKEKLFFIFYKKHMPWYPIRICGRISGESISGCLERSTEEQSTWWWKGANFSCRRRFLETQKLIKTLTLSRLDSLQASLLFSESWWHRRKEIKHDLLEIKQQPFGRWKKFMFVAKLIINESWYWNHLVDDGNLWNIKLGGWLFTRGRK